VVEGYGEEMVSFDPSSEEYEGLLFRGTGSMNYPEGEMRYIWDGRGTAGASAECFITGDGIRLRPRRAVRWSLGWPELVLPREEILGVERMFFGRNRFRSVSKALDGACFRPIGSAKEFLAALQRMGIPFSTPSRQEKLAFELRTNWNQMRWGGRLRRRHWKREQLKQG
jgi:hypothetical protein